MKVNFIRKPSNKNELMPQDDFIIEKVVEVDALIFEMFLNHLQDDYELSKTMFS